MLRLTGGAIKDQIGALGEAIFSTRIMRFCDDRPYFSAHFLGEKFPVQDYLVKALNETGANAILFAQVRSTLAGFETRNGRRYLNVGASKGDLTAMSDYPGPAYLFGVDVREEKAYFVAIEGTVKKGFSGLPMDYELTCETLPMLWAEVNAYWTDRATHRSRFTLR